jgi:hypothetical protein
MIRETSLGAAARNLIPSILLGRPLAGPKEELIQINMTRTSACQLASRSPEGGANEATL